MSGDSANAKADDSAGAKTAANTDAKVEAKGGDTEAKAGAKADATADAKADAKTDDGADAKADGKAAGREAPPATTRSVRADTPRSAVARERSESDAHLPPGPSRPGWMLPAALAAGALVVILILFKIKGGDDKPAKPTQQSQVAMAADARLVVPVVADAADLAVQTPDAQDFAAVPVDAQQAVVAPAIDAAVQVAAISPDAAVDNPKDPIKPKDPDRPKDPIKPKDPVDKPKDPVDKPKDPPESAKSIEELVAAGDFVKANKACKTNTIFNSGRLTACMIAACNAKDTNLAKRWIRAIAKAARGDLIKTCNALGVNVQDPSAP
jgi:hypothetical protein